MAEEYWTDLKYRALGADGDMELGGTDARALSGLEAMTQVLNTRIKGLGDSWWEEGGAPPLLDMLGRPRTEENRIQLELLIVECITDTVGVVGVSDVESSYGKGRSFTFSCSVQTVYGDTRAEVAV